MKLQQGQVGALDPPAGTLDVAWVFEGSSQLLLSLPMEKSHCLSWCASRRPETLLSNGPCGFVTFELELKLAKCGQKASGGCNIGLVS